MQETKLEQSGNRDVPATANPERHRSKWRVRLAVGLCAGLAMTGLAVHYLAPTVPGRAESLVARVGWYLDHGQVRADLRTLASAFDYLLQPERDLPGVTNQADVSLTAHPRKALPKS